MDPMTMMFLMSLGSKFLPQNKQGGPMGGMGAQGGPMGQLGLLPGLLGQTGIGQSAMGNPMARTALGGIVPGIMGGKG